MPRIDNLAGLIKCAPPTLSDPVPVPTVPTKVPQLLGQRRVRSVVVWPLEDTSVSNSTLPWSTLSPSCMCEQIFPTLGARSTLIPSPLLSGSCVLSIITVATNPSTDVTGCIRLGRPEQTIPPAPRLITTVSLEVTLGREVAAVVVAPVMVRGVKGIVSTRVRSNKEI